MTYIEFPEFRAFHRVGTVVDYRISFRPNGLAEVLKQVPRNIYLYKKADWDQLK